MLEYAPTELTFPVEDWTKLGEPKPCPGHGGHIQQLQDLFSAGPWLIRVGTSKTMMNMLVATNVKHQEMAARAFLWAFCPNLRALEMGNVVDDDRLRLPLMEVISRATCSLSTQVFRCLACFVLTMCLGGEPNGDPLSGVIKEISFPSPKTLELRMEFHNIVRSTHVA